MSLRRTDAEPGPPDPPAAPELAVARWFNTDGQGDAGGVGVDADGKRDAVLVQKRFERCRSHGFVVLEHGVQAQHGDGVAEGVLDALGLGQPVGHAARAQSTRRRSSRLKPPGSTVSMTPSSSTSRSSSPGRRTIIRISPSCD